MILSSAMPAPDSAEQVFVIIYKYFYKSVTGCSGFGTPLQELLGDAPGVGQEGGDSLRQQCSIICELFLRV